MNRNNAHTPHVTLNAARSGVSSSIFTNYSLYKRPGTLLCALAKEGKKSGIFGRVIGLYFFEFNKNNKVWERVFPLYYEINN
jgi:hypothetical protein